MRVTTQINTGKILADGSHPIRLAIRSHEGTKVLYLKGLSIQANCWNAALGRACEKRNEYKKCIVADNATAINSTIADAKKEAGAICTHYADKTLEEIMNKIKDKIRPYEAPRKISSRPEPSFNNYILDKADTFRKVGKFGYAERFEVSARKFREFLGTPKDEKNDIPAKPSLDIRFTDVNKQTFQAFINYMIANKNSAETARGTIKILKTAYFEAQEDGKAPESIPIRKLKYGNKATNNKPVKSLSDDEFDRIVQLNLSGVRELARDVFCFQFHCDGLRVGDAIRLHKKNIVNGKFVGNEQKTEKLKKVILNDEALSILAKYQNKGYLFFPELDKLTPLQIHNRVGGITVQLNADLKVIAKMADIHFPLTSHVARHTALQDGYVKFKGDMEMVRQMAGHSDIRQTQDYMKRHDSDQLAQIIFNARNKK